MNDSWVPSGIGIVLIFLVALYLKYHRNHPAERYVPAASWLRAGIYFCCCYLFAWYSGALPAALEQPVFTAAQAENPIWRAWVFGLFILITIGYWIIWARFTIRFERKLELLPQIVFGLLWGIAAGFLFLSFWHLVAGLFPSLPVWGVWLGSYFLISIWQWMFQDYGWDVYVSPEHDCPWSIAVKVPATHIPNVTFCLIFFAIYGNYWIFVALQTWALIGASIAMRMPSPWCRDETLPARQVPGLFGQSRARAAGYDAPDQRNDVYLRSTGLPAGTAIWVLAAHLFATLCPLFLLALVQQHMAYLDGVMYAPWLLYPAALIMMAGGAFEIAQNSFEHHWYFEEGTPGFFEAVFGTLTCVAMATMITAFFGHYLWLVVAVYGLALSYPVMYIRGSGRGIARATLGVLLVVSAYYSLGDPVVFLSLIAVCSSIYFFHLLARTKAQSFHGLLASVSAFGMLTIPLAIYNSATGSITAPWLVWLVAGVVVALALLCWRPLAAMQPTANARA